jgi:hypothetical protein
VVMAAAATTTLTRPQSPWRLPGHTYSLSDTYIQCMAVAPLYVVGCDCSYGPGGVSKRASMTLHERSQTIWGNQFSCRFWAVSRPLRRDQVL